MPLKTSLCLYVIKSVRNYAPCLITDGFGKGLLFVAMLTFNRIESTCCIYRNARKWGYFLTQREQLPSAVQHGCGPMPTNLFWLYFSLSLTHSLSTFLSTQPYQTLIITSPSLSAAISTNRERERDTHEQRYPLGSGFGRGDEAVLSNKQDLQLWTSCSVQELRHTHTAWSTSGRRRTRLFETLLNLIRAVCMTISTAYCQD